MASYRLCFVDEAEYVTNQIEIEAANDVDATSLAWAHSIRTNMTVEMWDAKGMITRTTPVAARLLAGHDDRAA